jgi:hypothetical protein
MRCEITPNKILRFGKISVSQKVVWWNAERLNWLVFTAPVGEVMFNAGGGWPMALLEDV